VRFEDVADEVYLGRPAGMANEFADLFHLTAARGHRPRLSATSAANPDEAFALVASGSGITPGPYHAPPMWPHAIARIPTVDIPPFTTRMLWRTGETDLATLAFVRHVLAEHTGALVR
jgi:DNA-binding transcriptional LysR family regulator